MAAIVMITSGCRENEKLAPEEIYGTQTLTFYATDSGNDGTKSRLGGASHRSVLFSANDSISLFSTRNASGVKLTTALGTVGSAGAAFTGTGIRDDRYYAVYPYTSAAGYSTGIISGLVIPAVQTATDGTYDPKAVITYATTANTSLLFTNLCPLLKIKISEAADSIVVTVSGQTTGLTGAVSVSTESPALSRAGATGQDNRVKLQGDIKKDTAYYISVIPGTYDAITVTAYHHYGNTPHIISTRHKSTSSTLEKGRIYDMGTMTVTQGLSPVDGTTGGRSSCGWVQLWEGGPKWAEFNLGSTAADYSGASPDSSHFGNYYAWGAKEARSAKCDSTHAVLSASDTTDTAFRLWKNGWKMPSKYYMEQLTSTNKCTWVWCDGSTVQYVPGCTIKGFKISGKGDYSMNHIFLPASGFWRKDGGTADTNVFCDYWTSTGITGGVNACGISCQTYNPGTTSSFSRSFGFAIRPIRD